MHTKCNWIIENFSNGSDIEELINEVNSAGHNLHLINRRTGFKYEDIQLNNECVVFYGSINMASIMKKHLGDCYPVIWENTTFDCTEYWPRYKHLLFNDKYEFVKISDFKKNKWFYYQIYAKEAVLFIRPNSGDKSFAGQLLDIQDFDNFFAESNLFNGKDNDIIVVSTPKTIIGEWRFIVTADKDIIGCSCYQYQGKIAIVGSAPAGATAIVEKVFEVGVYPADVFSIDIAQDKDGNFWLLEFNSFNSCGLYAINKKQIVSKVTELAIKNYELRNCRK